MRDRDRERVLVSAGWALALALGTLLIVAAACGGPSPSITPTSSGTPAPNESPFIAVGEGELRDGSGKMVAKATGSEKIDAAELGKRVANDPAWTQRLETARILGFTTVGAATVTRYDDGTEVTSAVLASGGLDRAILVHASGTMSGDFLLRPLLAGGTVASLEILGADGTVTLDLAKGEISGVDIHQSCSYWNCVGGAIYYWIDQNNFWDVVGVICDACFVGGACDLCLLKLPAVAVATAAGCAAFPCAWCYSDACGSTETAARWCSTEMGAPQVFESIRSHSCQNARTPDSECVERTDTKSVELCPAGCAGNNCAPVTCTSDVNCPRDAQDLGYVCVQGIPDVNPNIGQLYRYTERSVCDTSLCDTVSGPCTSLCARTCVATLIDVCAEGCWDSPPGSTGTAVSDTAPACNAESLPPGTGRCFSAAECTHDENIWIRVQRPGTMAGQHLFDYKVAPRECYTDPTTGSLSAGQPYLHYSPVRLPDGSQTCTWDRRYRDVTTCTGNCFSGTCDPTCDPNVCSGEVRLGEQQCNGGVLSALYRQKFCQDVAGGGSTCATRNVRHSFAICASGCEPDKRPGGHDWQCQGGQCALDCVRDEPVATMCREENGTAQLVEQVREYYCDSTVTSGDACRSRTVERTTACPGECLADGSGCALTCDPATCRGDSLSGYPSCAYNYVQYILEQTVDTKSCQPRSGGGEACVTTSQSRFKDTCPYGCTADRQACAPPSAVPRAPGEFVMLGGSTAGTLAFQWKDNSDNELGFRIYHGARFAIPPRPSYLIADVAANATQMEVTYERIGDLCFEVYAYNASGESAPAYYCTGF